MNMNRKNSTAIGPMEGKETNPANGQTAPTAAESKPSKEKPPKETVTAIRLDRIQPFKDHPFRVEPDEAMEQLKESIRRNGVLTPVTLRPLADGGYEMISGHRRMAVCKELGMETLPSIVRNLDDDEAILQMVDANQQREFIRPSEKAFAYKMRDDALKHIRAGRGVPPVGRTTEQIGKENDESDRNVRRYIRLTHLIPPILELVDAKKIGPTTAELLSYVPKDKQAILLSVMQAELCAPSKSQAKQLRQLHDDGAFTEEAVQAVFRSNKGKAAEKLSIPLETLERFFRQDETPARMIEAIVKALELMERKKKRDRQMER